jgi:hypothetical protein
MLHAATSAALLRAFRNPARKPSRPLTFSTKSDPLAFLLQIMIINMISYDFRMLEFSAYYMAWPGLHAATAAALPRAF